MARSDRCLTECVTSAAAGHGLLPRQTAQSWREQGLTVLRDERWPVARLIPITLSTGVEAKERNAASALLAVLSHVDEFGRALLKPLGAPAGKEGFEFDCGGVIWGRDLRWNPATTSWMGDPSRSHDAIVKRSGHRFTDLVKRTYRVLLTRGLKGCYVYFEEAPTRDRAITRAGPA